MYKEKVIFIHKKQRAYGYSNIFKNHLRNVLSIQKSFNVNQTNDIIPRFFNTYMINWYLHFYTLLQIFNMRVYTLQFTFLYTGVWSFYTKIYTFLKTIFTRHNVDIYTFYTDIYTSQFTPTRPYAYIYTFIKR